MYPYLSVLCIHGRGSWYSCSLVVNSDLVLLYSNNGRITKILNEFQLYVIIRKSVLRLGNFIFDICFTFTASKAEPQVLNPLAKLMKTILMYPAQVSSPAQRHHELMHIPVQQTRTLRNDWYFTGFRQTTREGRFVLKDGMNRTHAVGT